jgi:hypothetical protein
MFLKDLTSTPQNDPSDLLRIRDSIYAPDLLITSVGHLDLFSWLDNNPSDFNSIIDKFNIKPRPADVMLTYLKAIKLLRKENDLYYITDIAKEYLSNGSERNIIPFISTLTERPIVEKMLEVLRTDEPASWGGKKDELDWERAMQRDDFAEMFTAGMDSRAAYYAPGLAGSFDFSHYSSILDIAGASGIYAAFIINKYPQIKAAVLERHPVDKIAGISLKKRGLENKIEIISADMFNDDLPNGFDIHLYSHAMHDWDFNENKKLIRKSYQSLNKNGIIMIHDAHINREKDGPLSVAEYSVLLMFSTNGKCYSIGEMEDLLISEGFADIKYQKTVGNRSIITGRKR